MTMASIKDSQESKDTGVFVDKIADCAGEVRYKSTQYTLTG